MAKPRVGVLGLQGDFASHRAALEAVGVLVEPVTLAAHLERIDALVLPGGESTTMMTLIEAFRLRPALEAYVERRPVLGTCAGLILLGRDARGLPAPSLGVLDVSVDRNAYGRQVDSFAAPVRVPALGGEFPAVFIRAPRITRVGPAAEVVAWRRTANGDEPVGVRQGTCVGLCFHPELATDLRMHRWFLAEVASLELDPQVERVSA